MGSYEEKVKSMPRLVIDASKDGKAVLQINFGSMEIGEVVLNLDNLNFIPGTGYYDAKVSYIKVSSKDYIKLIS